MKHHIGDPQLRMVDLDRRVAGHGLRKCYFPWTFALPAFFKKDKNGEVNDCGDKKEDYDLNQKVFRFHLLILLMSPARLRLFGPRFSRICFTLDFPGATAWLFTLWFCLAPIATAEVRSARVKFPGEKATFPSYNLSATNYWHIDLINGEQFDASALLFFQGEILTVNDKGSEVYKIIRGTNHQARFQILENVFTSAQLAGFSREKKNHYDSEGLAQDEQGRLYFCEEMNRWILRYDFTTRKVERLPIDWAPVEKYFDKNDVNASFEGIAIGDGLLYVANERQVGRIIVVNLENNRVVDHFTVQPSHTNARDVHFSDLSFFKGHLYALLRESRLVLKIEPKSHLVLAEYKFADMELQPEFAYLFFIPTSTMEGLAVDDDFIWLVTDNNGYGRLKNPQDKRPTLFQCPRPDR